MRAKYSICKMFGAYLLISFVTVPLYMVTMSRLSRRSTQPSPKRPRNASLASVSESSMNAEEPTSMATLVVQTEGEVAKANGVTEKVIWKESKKRQAKEAMVASVMAKLPFQSKKEVANYLRKHEKTCLNDWMNRSVDPGMNPLCPCTPTTLIGWHKVKHEAVSIERTLGENPDVRPGGHWEPAECAARYRIVVVVPFRDRHFHLSVLLQHLHPVLRGQQLNYTVIVVEQKDSSPFNKASMMNIGYKYAKDQYDPNCVIFHDVDTIPEDGRHFYTCLKHPLHLGAYNSRHFYRLIYRSIFGGVTSFRPSTFEQVNGFSNRFSGWGGEDDDMSMRLRDHKLTILRDPRAVAGYTILLHARDKGNVQLDRKGMMFRLFRDRDSKHDGLNSLHFVVHKRRLFPLYTWLLVDVLNDGTKVGFNLETS